MSFGINSHLQKADGFQMLFNNNILFRKMQVFLKNFSEKFKKVIPTAEYTYYNMPKNLLRLSARII